MPRRPTIAFVAFSADGAERARRPLVHTGAVDLAAVDVVARLQLCSRRAGLVLTLIEPAPLLAELLRLCGLGAMVAVDCSSD